MLIDHTYFSKGTRQIQNATLGSRIPDANAVEVCKAIEAYIAEFQEEYLTAMLGQSIGNKVNAYLVCLDEDEDGSLKRIESYDDICAQLKEPFADYVFYHILRDMNTQATMTGLVRLKCANTYVSPIRKQVSVWNAMVDRHKVFVGWASASGHHHDVKKQMLTKINQFNL